MKFGLLRCTSSLKWAEQHTVTYIQLRYKQKKTQRYRAPHESKKESNQAWVSRKQSIQSKPKDTRGTDSPAWRTKTPTDDVWIRLYYPKPKLTLEDAIIRHREYAVPEILDSEDSLIYTDMMLDMTTTKKTKFMSQLRGTAHVPHQFEDQQEKRCIVFCEKSEEQQKALEMGAIAAGGTELIQSVQQGDITLEDFEFVLCTPDLLTHLIPIRALLKDRFPVIQKGNLSPNVEEMMLLFARGVSYKSQRISEAVAQVQIPFGQLNMPLEQLVENFQEVVTSVSSNRPAKLGPMISKVQIVSPPSEERFTLQLAGYVPGHDKKPAVKTEEAVREEKEKLEDSDSDLNDEAVASAER
ncbi:uncharacterized protein LOC135461283 isoform X2 [Liolophura sinensis]|uniref:uncharacterized protein LOC135461283 isoform X2 n=1 Tax=Liolophura sinensis TaxID=3198878 RepID=UPI003157F662